jgi:hypothetical protein
VAGRGHLLRLERHDLLLEHLLVEQLRRSKLLVVGAVRRRRSLLCALQLGKREKFAKLLRVGGGAQQVVERGVLLLVLELLLLLLARQLQMEELLLRKLAALVVGGHVLLLVLVLVGIVAGARVARAGTVVAVVAAAVQGERSHLGRDEVRVVAVLLVAEDRAQCMVDASVALAADEGLGT